MPYLTRFSAFIVVSLMAVALAGCGQNAPQNIASDDPSLSVLGLKTPAAFAMIANDQARAAAVFDEMMLVLAHPRCANCHPVTGGPTQGDDMQPHNPPVVRGAGMGAPGMTCDTCHLSENVSYASMEGSIPGALPWLLAPESMGWRGKSASELCIQLKDVDLNGGRSLQDLVAHNSDDHLVDWAWHPGEGRTPAPGNQKTFGALTAAWVEAGAHCPSS
ncbi:MAG: Isoquinoline 1-oxidoreductase subunit [Pseudomonadota bacterium]